jgi:LPXTG-motif cell wall-anchored protein
MTLRRLMIAMSGAAFLLWTAGNVSYAQETPPPPKDRPAATTADDRDDFDLGWIGLLGLIGLAGLMGTRRRDVGVRTTTTRT